MRGSIALLAIGCVACGGDDAARPTATSTPTASAAPAPVASALDGCVTAGPGIEIAASRAVVGRGRSGVVTVSGPGGDACQWLEPARRLARHGLRVQISETGVGDAPEKVLANVRRMRRAGIGRVALLSTSAGGSAAIAAARRDGRIAALVTLSAVRYADGTDAARRAARLGMPMLHVGSRKDPATGEGADTRRFGRAGDVLLVDGAAHGTDLLAEHPELVARIAGVVRGR